jgi:hypothetical protein
MIIYPDAILCAVLIIASEKSGNNEMIKAVII